MIYNQAPFPIYCLQTAVSKTKTTLKINNITTIFIEMALV